MSSRLAAPGKVPVLSVLGCPGRSQDIPFGCTGHKVPVLSVLRCPGRCTGHKVPVLSALRCPGRSRDIPLLHRAQSPSPKCPGMSREIPVSSRLAAPGKVPVLRVLGCPWRSQDIPLGCTGHKVPVLSVLGCPGRSQCHPAWLHRAKSQSYVSWDVPGDPRTSRLAAPAKSQS